jgi:hypothetical protein
MALFPTTKYPDYGYQSWQEENIVRNDPRAAKIMGKDMWGRTRFRARMRFSLLKDDTLTVAAFWKQNRLTAFDFIDYDDDIYILDRFRDSVTKAILTTTHGGNTYELQAKNVRNVTVYVAAVAQASNKYNITEGVGNDGLARLVWTAGNIPAAAQDIAVSYTGQRIFSCKVITVQPKESIAYGRLAFGIEVAESI